MTARSPSRPPMRPFHISCFGVGDCKFAIEEMEDDKVSQRTER